MSVLDYIPSPFIYHRRNEILSQSILESVVIYVEVESDFEMAFGLYERA